MLRPIRMHAGKLAGSTIQLSGGSWKPGVGIVSIAGTEMLQAKRPTWTCPSCGWKERPRASRFAVIICPACKVLMNISIRRKSKKKKHERRGSRALRFLNDLDVIRRD